MSRLPSGLIAITDREQAQGPLIASLRAALDAGFAAVMIREKDLPGGPLHALAEALEPFCRSAGASLLVNDRLDVALSFPGVGAHVGIQGIPVADARRLLGPDRILGYSAHAVREAQDALDAGADYVTLSPIFPSGSKPDYAPRGIAFLEDAVRELPAGTVVALGGVDAGNLAAVRRTGVRGAAIMGTLMRASDPEAVARALVAAWNAGG